jgi:hypothetical protein
VVNINIMLLLHCFYLILLLTVYSLDMPTYTVAEGDGTMTYMVCKTAGDPITAAVSKLPFHIALFKCNIYELIDLSKD